MYDMFLYIFSDQLDVGKSLWAYAPNHYFAQ